MKQARPFLISGGMAILSALLVFGGFAAAFSEGGVQAPSQPSSTSLNIKETASPTKPADTAEEDSGSADPDKGEKADTSTPEKGTSPTATKIVTTAAATKKPSNTPKPNTSVPNPTNTKAPTNTPGPTCGPPAGWTTYIIKSGDTLFSISQAFSTTVAQLQLANCLGSSTIIKSGEALFVPNVATITPEVTATKTPKPTDTATSKTSTTTTITSALPDPSVVGESITVVFTVTGSGGTPTGNVTVTDGTNNCVATVAMGTCDIVLSSAGAKTIHASYAGDSNFKSSTSANEAHTVNQADTTTTITSTSVDPSNSGDPVTMIFTVSVDAPGIGTATGTVTINSDNDAATCSASVAVGTCDITLTTLGPHNLTADYAGDSNFNSSTSAPEAHTVNP